MEKENHIFQGMRRDNHQIKQKPEFLWDALNIRITNRDDNTLFSITNERGTSSPLLTLTDSKYVGHCVLGKYLVVFTEEGDYSAIHRIEKTDDVFKDVVLYRGENLFKGEDNERLWSAGNPIQTIGFFETELVQKVYWIDGRHQPRVINIMLPELKGVEPNELELTDTSFDFVQTLKLEEEVTVIKQYGSGMFAPGVIQYAFTYYNKYGQETNIFYTTPLQYISHKDRGGREDEKIANSFRIVLNKLDDFAFVRVYSIHRTSLSAIPTVKLVEDVDISHSKDKVIVVDDGRKGSVVDNDYLLFMNRNTFIPNAFTVKDNTMFFGNFSLMYGQNEFNDIIKGASVELTDVVIESIPNSTENTYYSNTSSLSTENSARFKTNEVYRLGIQIQDKMGMWSNPIFIDDAVLTDTYPQTVEGSIVSRSKAVVLDSATVKSLIDKGAVRIRTCIVMPDVNDRSILCQGVLCPTLYSADGRHKSTVYSMPSWFFRAAGEDYGKSIQYRHNHALYSGMKSGAEIQDMVPVEGKDKVTDITEAEYDDFKPYFFVDENIVTFHSPDIEFDTDLANFPFDGTGLNVIGMSQLGAIYGDIDIETSSPDLNGKGFKHSIKGFKTFNEEKDNNGLGAGFFYNGSLIEKKDSKYSAKETAVDFFVYPWHRNGSLNNDETRTDGSERTAVLLKKKISNLRFFDRNYPFSEKMSYKITTPELHDSNELSMLKINVPYNSGKVIYNGNIDTLVHSENEYPIYISDIGTGSIEDKYPDGSYIEASTEPVRMKYKSTKHLVFALSSDNLDIPILPRHSSLDNLSGTFTVPKWWDNMNIGKPDEDKNGISPYGDLVIYRPTLNGYVLGGYNESSDAGKCILTAKGLRVIGSKDGFPDNLNGKILRVASGTCEVVKKDAILPDTDESDYEPRIASKPDLVNIYKGPDLYYKLVDTGEKSDDGHVMYDLELYEEEQPTKAPGITLMNIVQESFSEGGEDIPPYLLLAEITRDIDDTVRFGGKGEQAYMNNLWFPSGDPEILKEGESVKAEYKYGDTWYQRYDCLKTYAFTQEDQNQIVDIGSFLCETRVNIDGRTDRNKGQLSNLNMTPEVFNRMNEVYNQKDNFFNYRILDEDFYKNNIYANQVTWTLEKVVGADVDNWTNITLANILDMDGSKGKVTSLNVWNDNLLCLQERQFSQLLYNPRVQIPVSDGVPIEIGNGRKMEGSRVINDSIGCKNNLSTLTSPYGFYFIDSDTDGLYIFNSKLTNITEERGMSWWLKEHHGKVLKLFNDNIYGDVYLVPDDDELALCFSEKLGQFTSQMSYGMVPAMFNYDGGFYSLNNRLKLYQNNAGEYNDFYGVPKPWYFSFISNENPTVTKVFDTVDLRMDMYRGNELHFRSPVNYMKVTNEYQGNTVSIPERTDYRSKNMMRKFRIWRGIIPRNRDSRERIRNTWTEIKLEYRPVGDRTDTNNIRSVIHDVSVNYHM